MTLSTHNKSLDQTIAAIQAFDLSAIKFKTTCKDDGYGWSADYADKMEVAYKRYLILHAKHPEMTLAPERDIDRFWHMHILDTRQYANDCQASFGHFVHHFPYLGLRGEEDVKTLQSAFAATQRLYAQEFGEAMPALQRDASTHAIESGPAQAAFCSVESSRSGAAFCSVESIETRAAFCSVESSSVQAAFCSVESAGVQAAFCSVASPGVKAAFCSVEQAHDLSRTINPADGTVLHPTV